jgi:hypothetical protein
VVLVEVFDVRVSPLRASLAGTVKGPKTIKVRRLYGFGLKLAPIRTHMRSLAHKLFYGLRTCDVETHKNKGRKAVYDSKPYSSGKSPPAPPPAAALLWRQIAAVPCTHRRIYLRQWLPGAVAQVWVAAASAEGVATTTASTEWCWRPPAERRPHIVRSEVAKRRAVRK